MAPELIPEPHDFVESYGESMHVSDYSDGHHYAGHEALSIYGIMTNRQGLSQGAEH